MAPAATTPSDSTPPADTTPPRHPVTRLQHEISRPKIYTDGTVRWGMTTTTMTEEPATVEEALGDPKWVTAMDSEYKALIHYKT
jgi:hypothetical protein